MGWFDFITKPIDNLLGNVGLSFLDSEHAGRAIENWSNPITQLSDRNPILNLAKGTGDWTGADAGPKWYETSLNDANKAAALAYGGAYAGGLTAMGEAGGTVGGEGLSLGGDTMSTMGSAGATGGDTLSTIPSSSILETSPSTAAFTMDNATAGMTPAASKSGMFSNILGGGGDTLKTMALLNLAGAGLDYAGGTQNESQAEKNKQDYLNQTTWTPERTNTYLSNLTNLVGGVYGENEENKKKSLANMMSASGRGGGAFGEATERLARERREATAKALTQGLMTTSAPASNLNASMFNIPSASGTALTNLGGAAGKTAQTLLLLKMLQGARVSGAGTNESLGIV